jgi:hypothetical protein
MLKLQPSTPRPTLPTRRKPHPTPFTPFVRISQLPLQLPELLCQLSSTRPGPA